MDPGRQQLEARSAELATTRTQLARLLVGVRRLRQAVYDVREAAGPGSPITGDGPLHIIAHNVAQRVTELVHTMEDRERTLTAEAEQLRDVLEPGWRPPVAPVPPINLELQKIFGRHRRRRGG